MTGSPEVNAAGLARAFGVTPARVSQWRVAGMPFNAAGRITYAAALAWRLERDGQVAARMSRSEAKERLAVVRAELAELELDRLKASLCVASEVAEARAEEHARVLRIVRAMPRRFAPLLVDKFGCTHEQAVAVLEVVAAETCALIARDDDEEVVS